MKGLDVKKKLLDSGYKLTEVAESMGIIPQNLQTLLSAKDIKTGVLEEIAKSINKSIYFFYGEEVTTTFNSDLKTIPLIPIEAMAGFGEGSVQVMNYDTSNYLVPEFSELNVDFMVRVKGSSMYPKYNSGDLVACKKLNISDLFFQWNKVYVLDTEQGALIKRIKKGTDAHHVQIISDNVKYEPFELPLDKIYAVSLVVGVIRFE